MTDVSHSNLRLRHRLRLPLAHWSAVWRSRRALARLEPHLLRDIGLRDFEAAQEAAHPIWDVPAPWRGRK